jgi:transcriptional regulator with XRE-family HTH domain
MNLKELREKKGMSAVDVAKMMGMARQSVWFWEQGRHLPSINKLPILEKVYGKDFIDSVRVTLKEKGKWIQEK